MRIAKALLPLLFIFFSLGCTQQIHYKSLSESIPAGAQKMSPEGDFFPPILHSSEFELPVMFEPASSAGAEDSPFVSQDGSILFFFFTPDVDVPVEQQVLDGATGIWWVRKTASGWTQPERVVLSNGYSLDGCPFYQDNALWFCSVRAGNLREIDIWFAEYDSEWKNWQNAGEELNLRIGIGEFHFNEFQDTVYFHAVNNGSMDIYLSRKANGIWQSPEALAGINSGADEGWPYVNMQETELWFTRFYQGSPAIFRSKKSEGVWQSPELIVSQFAGEPTLDNEGNLYFVHHYFSDSGEMIEADIYVAYSK